jgi:hypothetical protein
MWKYISWWIILIAFSNGGAEILTGYLVSSTLCVAHGEHLIQAETLSVQRTLKYYACCWRLVSSGRITKSDVSTTVIDSGGT